MTFILRASIDSNGVVHGVVVHAQTGRKEPFLGTDQLALVVTAMAEQDEGTDSGLAQLGRPRQ
jgi:hypothetical protein